MRDDDDDEEEEEEYGSHWGADSEKDEKDEGEAEGLVKVHLAETAMAGEASQSSYDDIGEPSQDQSRKTNFWRYAWEGGKRQQDLRVPLHIKGDAAAAAETVHRDD